MSRTYSHQNKFLVGKCRRECRKVPYIRYSPPAKNTKWDDLYDELYGKGFSGLGRWHWQEKKWNNERRRELDKFHKLEMEQIEPHFYHAKGKNKKGPKGNHKPIYRAYSFERNSNTHTKRLTFDGKVVLDFDRYKEMVQFEYRYHSYGIFHDYKWVEGKFPENSPHLNCVHKWEEHEDGLGICLKCGLIRR